MTTANEATTTQLWAVVYRTTPFGNQYAVWEGGLSKEAARASERDLQRYELTGDRALCPTWVVRSEEVGRILGKFEA